VLPGLPPFDLVVFDKDGVLQDFHLLWGAVTHARAEAACEAAGRPELREGLVSLLGLAADGRVRPQGLLAVGSRDDSRAAAATYLHQAGLPWHLARRAAAVGFETADAAVDRTGLTRPLPGVADALRALHGAGVRLAIATTDQTAGARHFLAVAGLEALFDAVAGVDRVAASKPDPALFLLACREAGVPPGRALMVGDVDLDLLMGRAGGCAATVGVLSGVGDRTLLAPHADLLVEGVGDLRGIAPG
jgi:phosphoglycolate phosphatase